MRRALLVVGLVIPLGAQARDHICYVNRVTTQPHVEGENPSGLTVYANWGWGINITRSDGTKTFDNYRSESERFLRESQDRVRVGQKPLPTPERLTKPPHFVLHAGDAALASMPHNSCAFTAKAESGGLVLELKATHCREGRCDSATEVVAPEVVEK